MIVKFCGTMKTLIELAPVVLHILYTAGNVLAGFVQPYILLKLEVVHNGCNIGVLIFSVLNICAHLCTLIQWNLSSGSDRWIIYWDKF